MEKITVNRLKSLVQEFIIKEKDEMENSTEWAYVMLEPVLVESLSVTLDYLNQITEEEFNVLGENHWFEHIVGKFKSAEVLDIICLTYHKFYGESTDTEFYRDNIEGLRNCIKNK